MPSACVLLVAGSETTLRLRETILWRNGFQKHVCVLETALAEALRLGPQLVIVEMRPWEEGLELVRALRAHPDTRHVSLAVLTEPLERHQEEAVREAGANLVLAGTPLPVLWDAWIEELVNVPRRREVRVPVRFAVWVHLQPQAASQAGRSVNVSLRGMLLETPAPLDIGSKLDVAFRLPAADDEIRITGQVVREERVAQGGRSLGVEWVALPDAAAERIRRFVSDTTSN